MADSYYAGCHLCQELSWLSVAKMVLYPACHYDDCYYAECCDTNVTHIINILILFISLSSLT